MNLFKDKIPLMGQDPFIARCDGMYLLCESEDEKRICVTTMRSNLQGRIQKTIVWETEEEQVWAPELHKINGYWFIYYSSSDGNNRSHRNKVLCANDPFGPFHRPVTMVGEDIWGIDMTVFHWWGDYYACWSGWERNNDDYPQNLYIAKMYTPTEIGERVKISHPDLPWERSIEAINEGPQAFVYKNKLHLLYSANASWSQEYATGVLEFTGGNLLDAKNWLKCPFPLAKNMGHGMFCDGRFIYHRKMGAFPGWNDREICNADSGLIVNGKEFQTFKGETGGI